ncbi:putative late blight resistance protein R1A-6 [Orchesella cincta]|uniref:Putative late blight resistance protein R1A-6 n=1 Tax=Orchesella cincta TaxID=48709 RepID=A0A1D2MXR5_ORCCI|nr:putative late blight resistance protein R1A-6 [Orchesella cincta]
MDGGDIVAEGSNPLDQDIIAQILSNVHGKSLLEQRTICKAWNDIILGSSRLNYKVHGSPQSIETFKDISSPYPYFSFMGLNLETDVFGDPVFFRRFSVNFCPTIKSLAFLKCELPTGRFFELLAFCKKLDRLVIKMSPTILEPDMGILHWGFCFKNVKRTLAGLSVLIISEKNIPEKTLFGLTAEMAMLKALQIGIEDGFLPVYSIGKILRKNANTLRCLTLRGPVHPASCTETGLFPIDLPTMKNLEVLSLIRQNFYNSHVDMLEKFLNKCPQLNTLFMTGSYIGKTTLSKITDNLTKLTLHLNHYEENLFEGHYTFPKLKLLKLAQGADCIGSEDAFRQLLSNHFSELETLELELLIDASVVLKGLMNASYPNLKTMKLAGCIGIAGPALRHIFKDFNSLTSLSITNCPEITDESLCPQANVEETSLANMKGLQFLDLSETEVGNQTITKCIIGMKNLEIVKLNGTKVTQGGLSIIVKSLKSSLTKIFAKRLPCVIKMSGRNEWYRVAPKLEISCSLEVKGTVVEID